MSTDKVNASTVERKYRSGVQAFARQIADPALRLSFTQEADSYFRRCARAIWHRGGDVTQEHVDAYNAICSGDNQAPRTLYFELAVSVEHPPEFAPPGFFEDLVRADGGRHRLTDQFVQLCSLLFLLFAAVGDGATDREVAYARDCVSLLRQAAQGAPVGRAGSSQTPSRTSEAPKGGDTLAQTETETAPTQPQPEQQPQESVEDLLAELDSLCGLDQVKQDVRSLINLVKVRTLREENHLPVPPMSLHLVFLGNPGTGKTTVARLLGRLYHSIGVLSQGQLVETDRSGLVAGYVGQTAIKTQEVIDRALGGVLFIDEAYSLTNQEGGNDFGREAIEILLKNMEDHREDFIVIVAGYTDLMERFIHANPGLESRFNKYFYFSDYTAEQLLEILEGMCGKNGYQLSQEAKEACRDLLEEAYRSRDENFGNAREVRNLFEDLVARQSDRVAQMESPTLEDLMLLTAEDFKAARDRA